MSEGEVASLDRLWTVRAQVLHPALVWYDFFFFKKNQAKRLRYSIVIVSNIIVQTKPD